VEERQKDWSIALEYMFRKYKAKMEMVQDFAP